MKVVVIYIEGDAKTYPEELASFGITDYEVFPGIVKEIGAHGVSESFKAIVCQAISEGHEKLLIFESDVKFTSKFSRENWDICVSQLPCGWDMLLGGSYQYKEVSKIGGLIKVGDFSSLHCVLLNVRAMSQILKHNTQKVIDMNLDHIDRYLGWHSKNDLLDVYLCNPQVAIQHNGFSRTRKQKVDYDYLLKDKNILHD